METTLTFLNLVFVGFFALLPPVNPVGTAFIVEPFLHRLTRAERRGAAAKITLYCFLICTGALLIGSWIFQLFGISLPVVQLAGGTLICRMGWELLASNDGKQDSHESSSPSHEKKTEDILFYPLAFPMTTGAGTISVILTLTAHSEAGDLSNHLVNLSAIFLAIVVMCVLIYICYAFTPALLGKLGARGEQVVNRLSAYLVFCVGIQIASNGIFGLLRQFHATT
ncbi:MAG TPA: MarC family protein [Verrucomicrobiae bacterium]|nr:MarC family protein [Verrucomicrobiae bacterium]